MLSYMAPKGRQIFSPKKIGGLVDVTPDSSNLSAIGKEAYGIRFIEGATIYSKYKIVRDVRGDKRIGFLGISLIIPNNKRLSGSNIVSLLNEVLLEYCRRYMAEGDNNLRGCKRSLDIFGSDIIQLSGSTGFTTRRGGGKIGFPEIEMMHLFIIRQTKNWIVTLIYRIRKSMFHIDKYFC